MFNVLRSMFNVDIFINNKSKTLIISHITFLHFTIHHFRFTASSTFNLGR